MGLYALNLSVWIYGGQKMCTRLEKDINMKRKNPHGHYLRFFKVFVAGCRNIVTCGQFKDLKPSLCSTHRLSKAFSAELWPLIPPITTPPPSVPECFGVRVCYSVCFCVESSSCNYLDSGHSGEKSPVSIFSNDLVVIAVCFLLLCCFSQQDNFSSF